MHGDYVDQTISNILIFTTLMLMHMMKIMTTQLTVVLDMQIPFSLMNTFFSHIYLFKYQNVMFNLKSATEIHSDPFLVSYLLI